jgi:hypothetical protein
MDRHVEATLKDHEQRLRALERWSAWAGGALGTLALLFELVKELMK